MLKDIKLDILNKQNKINQKRDELDILLLKQGHINEIHQEALDKLPNMDNVCFIYHYWGVKNIYQILEN